MSGGRPADSQEPPIAAVVGADTIRAAWRIEGLD
jgi:hypothetical protein